MSNRCNLSRRPEYCRLDVCHIRPEDVYEDRLCNPVSRSSYEFYGNELPLACSELLQIAEHKSF
jgi:hypothetical protein